LPLREYGASATSIERVLAYGGTSRGSVHRCFPDSILAILAVAVAAEADDDAAGCPKSAAHAWPR
jgi:hypothetical protein